MSRKIDPKEQLVQRIRDLRKQEANRKCFDCSEKAPTYVCLTFNTFICMTCSGIHRQFNRKVKSITASEFTEEEVQALEQGGNDAAAKQWLATWRPSDFAEPSASDAAKIKEFMVRKYDQKRWVKVEVAKPKKKPTKKSAKTSSERVAKADEEPEDTEEKPPQKADLGNLSSIIGYDEENPAPEPVTSKSDRRSAESSSKSGRKSSDEEPKVKEKKKSSKADTKKSAKPAKRSSVVENLLDIDSLISNTNATKEEAQKSEEEPWGFEAETQPSRTSKGDADWGNFIGQPASNSHPSPAIPHPVNVAAPVDVGLMHFHAAPMMPGYAISPQIPSSVPSPAISATTASSKLSTPSEPSPAPLPVKKDDPFAVLMSGDEVPVHYSLEESKAHPKTPEQPSTMTAIPPVAPPMQSVYAPPPGAYYMPPAPYGYPGAGPYVYYPGAYPQGPVGVPPGAYPPYYVPYGYPPGAAPPPSQ